ncbi:MAG: transcriptional regulator/antitoxin, MazE [Gemmatimonadaceae bacterium]
MITTIQKWGNSQGLRLSKTLLGDAGLDLGDSVDVVVRNGDLVITPVRRVRGGHNLRSLVRQIPKDYQLGVVDWDAPVGREVW